MPDEQDVFENHSPMQDLDRLAALFAVPLARIGYELENIKADLEANTFSQGEREALLEALINLEDRLRPLTINVRNAIRTYNLAASQYRAANYKPLTQSAPLSLSDAAERFDL